MKVLTRLEKTQNFAKVDPWKDDMKEKEEKQKNRKRIPQEKKK